MIKYKINILSALKDKGYSSYALRKHRIFGEGVIQKYRQGECVSSFENLDMLCSMLECQPGDLLEYVPD